MFRNETSLVWGFNCRSCCLVRLYFFDLLVGGNLCIRMFCLTIYNCKFYCAVLCVLILATFFTYKIGKLLVFDWQNLW